MKACFTHYTHKVIVLFYAQCLLMCGCIAQYTGGVTKDDINYYPLARAHVIDATHVNRRVGAMKPYADNWNEPLPGSRSRTTSNTALIMCAHCLITGIYSAWVSGIYSALFIR